MSELPPVQVENVSLAYRLARNRAGTLKEFAFQMLKRQVSFEKLPGSAKTHPNWKVLKEPPKLPLRWR